MVIRRKVRIFLLIQDAKKTPQLQDSRSLVEVVMDAEKCFESIASGSKDAQPTSKTTALTNIVKYGGFKNNLSLIFGVLAKSIQYMMIYPCLPFEKNT